MTEQLYRIALDFTAEHNKLNTEFIFMSLRFLPPHQYNKRERKFVSLTAFKDNIQISPQQQFSTFLCLRYPTQPIQMGSSTPSLCPFPLIAIDEMALWNSSIAFYSKTDACLFFNLSLVVNQIQLQNGHFSYSYVTFSFL